jgi:hypothetical protein
MIVLDFNHNLLAMMEPLPQWLNFLAMAAAILVAAMCALLWLVKFRKKGKRKRRHHGHEKRQSNPTLAQTGGLPPVRENEKSPGQTPPS